MKKLMIGCAAVIALAGALFVIEHRFGLNIGPASAAPAPAGAAPATAQPATAATASPAPPTEAAASPAPVTAAPASSAGGGGGQSAVLLAAGDIADCDSPGDEATARLVDKLDGTVAALGDNVYNSGKLEEYAKCYDPSWGRFKERTRPAVGDHEYGTKAAQGYFDYFGAAAGDPGKGYYSYDLGAWHIVVLNSNCEKVGGCGEGSAQEQWLRADLAAHAAQCTLAYWHFPLFSSDSRHGNFPTLRRFWDDLQEAGAELVLNGHAHNYERFAPIDARGTPDAQYGIREFVVGTGGRDHRSITDILANSEVRNDDTFGVLKLTLHPDGYEWQFIPEAGKAFTDAGSGRCHTARAKPAAESALPGPTLSRSAQPATAEGVTDSAVERVAVRRDTSSEGAG